jgi:hypothetical protein
VTYCWFIGKIHMRLAASGALVAAKRRAVKPVNKVKIVPVYSVTDLLKALPGN